MFGGASVFVGDGDIILSSAHEAAFGFGVSVVPVYLVGECSAGDF